MENIQVIILAGGKGKRMETVIPKVLVPFHAQPMIDYVIDAVSHSGVTTKPILVVGYESDMVINHVGEKANYALQAQQLGTGHAVKCAENSVPDNITDVLVLYGDQPAITGAMISNLIRVHLDGDMPLTMATVDLPSFDSWYKSFLAFGRIVRDDDKNIKKIVEYKDATEEQKEITEVNPGYCCFKKDWLFSNLEKVKNENAQGEYYLTDLISLAVNTGIASVHISPEEALGVNTIEQLHELENLIKKSN